MPALLRKDERLGEGVDVGRWAVVRKIGDGGFAEVYEVRDTLSEDQRFALKIDKLERRKDARGGTVKAEHKVLAQLQECKLVCRLVPNGEGTWEGRSYLLMELLGLNLAMYQRAHPHNGRIHPTEAKRIGLTILNALEGIHCLGWLHRDVKPANFALYQGPGAPASGDWRVIDFGIARRYTADSGAVLPRREDYAEFRGSTTYASINAHLKQDLGRVDDLWSWLYIVVEMLEGSLPWRARSGSPGAGGGAGGRGATGGGSGGSSANGEENPKQSLPVEKEREGPKDAAQRWKQQCLDDPSRLAASGHLPRGLVAASHYLRQLAFEDEPDYQRLRSLLAGIPEPAPVLATQHPPQHGMQQHPAAAGHRLANGAAGTPPPATPMVTPQPLQLPHRWQSSTGNGYHGYLQHPAVNGHRQEQNGAGGAYQQAYPPQPSPFAPRGRHQPSPFAPQSARQAVAGPPQPQGGPYAGRPPYPHMAAGEGHPQQPPAWHAQTSCSTPPTRQAPHTPSYAVQPQPPLHHHQQQHQQQWQGYVQVQVHANGVHAPREEWAAGAPPLPQEPPEPGVAPGTSSMDELGQIGSEFEPEEDGLHMPWRAGAAHCSRAQEASATRSGELRVCKHAREREDTEGEGVFQGGASRAAKRLQVCCGVPTAAIQVSAAEQGTGDMAQFAAVVAQGRLSQEALEVKEKLCSLAPAEGVGILAWLVETLSKNAQPPSSQHVGHWLSSLATFTHDCAARCQAVPP